MHTNVIRPIALGIVWKDDALLVFEGHDSTKPETFYRPLGGGIRFGESGAQAVKRELHEEIGAEVAQVQYLGTLENIFTYRQHLGHEIAMIYVADLANLADYAEAHFEGYEDNGLVLQVLWKPLRCFETGAAILYPTGLVPLLQRYRSKISIGR